MKSFTESKIYTAVTNKDSLKKNVLSCVFKDINWDFSILYQETSDSN